MLSSNIPTSSEARRKIQRIEEKRKGPLTEWPTRPRYSRISVSATAFNLSPDLRIASIVAALDWSELSRWIAS